MSKACYQQSIANPFTRAKCESRVAKGSPDCMAMDAIHMSFCGIGLPSLCNCAEIRPYC